MRTSRNDRKERLMGKYSVVGTEVPKVMRHVASCTKGKHLGMHVQSKLQHSHRSSGLWLLDLSS